MTYHLKNIAFKAMEVMPSLLLQKPSKISKSKDHSKELRRRLDSWKSGDIEELIFEATAIQNPLNYMNRLKVIVELPKCFVTVM